MGFASDLDEGVSCKACFRTVDVKVNRDRQVKALREV